MPSKVLTEAQIKAVLHRDPDLAERVIGLLDQPPIAIDRSYTPNLVQVVCDGFVVASGSNGISEFEIALERNAQFHPEVIAIEFDEQPVWVKAQGILLLNRLESQPEWLLKLESLPG